AAGKVLHRLAKDMPVQLDAAFAGRADQPDRDPRIKRLGHNRGLAIAGEALDTHFLRVYPRVRVLLEVVYQPADAPRPGPQRAPIVRFSRLALIAQADDAGP